MEPRSAERGNPGSARAPPRYRGASMEPRSAERGNSTYAARSNARPIRFNGATLSRTWKRGSGEDYLRGMEKLQWSHAQPNVETPTVTAPVIWNDAVLQWSHAQPNVETEGG